MKKLLRKNQIIITALVVMVALAGYLSLTDEEDLAVGVLNQSEQAAGGEGKDAAENVAAENGTGSAVQDDTVADISDEDVAAEEKKSDNEVSSKENAGEAVLVSNTVTGDYFEAAKLSREQTRAKNKETLLELVNSNTASEAQKEKAMNEIVAMTAINEKETATENLLAAKGFQDVVVTIVDDSVDVIVNAESLKEQQIAQIEDVVKRKLECASDKIVISPVGKK
ncbi:MAG: SpoIIIAH-like family protein [Eubacterium sp.]|nr:SpoIIIAH-like family protein [Eubacterium sp.]MCI9412497.1 SpoIIIAH-like family protein [Eubacterium sp.]